MQRYRIVTRFINSGVFRTLIMAAVMWLACPQPVLALEYFIKTGPDMDSLRFVFDSKGLDPQVKRTGRQQITVSFAPGALKDEKDPTPLPLASMRILNAINIGSSDITINTKTNAFGYIRIPAGNGELRIQFFRDPFGAKWRPPEPPKKRAKKSAPKKKPEKVKPRKQESPAEKLQKNLQQDVKSDVVDDAVPEVRETDIVPQGESEPEPVVRRRQEPSEGRANQDAGKRRPFYSVPYTYRAPVAKVGPGEAKAVNTSTPPPPSGNANYSESIGMNEQGIDPEADESSVGGAVSSGPSAGGMVSGAVAPPGGAGAGEVVPPRAEEESWGVEDKDIEGAGQVRMKVGGPQTGGQVASPEGDVSIETDGKPGVAGAVAPPPDEAGAESVAEPDIDIAEKLSADEGASGTVEMPVEGNESEGLAARINGTDSGMEATPEDAFPIEDPGASDTEEGAKEPSLQERITTAKGLLLAAESSLEAGELDAAMTGFTEVSNMAELPKDIRMRALYGKAETITEMYRDSLAENFNKVSSAWMEAMNADTNSPNVPNALLNLGLANLKVGNMPEAKAYFNLLKSQYPNDLNIPYISYYWGEYYLEKGEYEKAADQFQYLVQMYPDSKVVREAALGLSKALDALGYYKQSFQIIDYIDKRWPRFYIEYPDFLLMAANTENTLGKLEPAKEHYWAYYNLMPESDENDVVLARLGDVYLREDDKRAAKEIYQKAIKNYPDQEGGLVSKMRLAEEGIYDDPSMSQMDKVFDRPYNLRPQKVYSSIVDDHPNSPLAPLAQLKLAMWYYWNKNYGDCLGAVQDFIDNYSRSRLLPKARELGYRVFDKAVPQLVKDENYGRVIRFWNSYGKSNNDGEGINDDTRLGVALSFWKRDNPQEALRLIERYLQKDQVPKYSSMALDMALGIYVENQSWSNVTSLVDMVSKNWDVDRKQKAQMDFATAMAYENLGETERSTPLWAGLASNLLLPPSSRAYAMYYMAKSAMKKKDLKKLFVYAQEALSMLLETGGDREKIKDSILMTIYSAESSGRYREALKWAAEYDKYIPESDPEWASSRFRLAQLYEKAGATAEWKKLMQEVAEKRPEGLYGRLAKSALETHRIENEASKFEPARGF